MKRNLIAFLVVLVLVLVPIGGVGAATTADVTVNATPEFISIAVNNATYTFGVIAASSVTNTTAGGTYFVINNTSTVQTDQAIAVTTANWTGGAEWIHSDTCTPGADTAGMKASEDGTAWMVVNQTASNYIAENQAADTDYSFGLSLHAPTSFTDGIVKEIVVRVTAAAG